MKRPHVPAEAQQKQRGRISDLEARLAFELHALGVREYSQQFKVPGPSRGWLFDFAWPQYKIAAEVDGGTFMGGRHVRGVGYREGCEKVNTVQLWGWQVYRFDTAMVKCGIAAATLQVALQRAGYDTRKGAGDRLCEAVTQGTGTLYAGIGRSRRKGTARRGTW